MKEHGKWIPHWIVIKYADQEAFERGEPYEECHIADNVLANAGIDELWDLVCGTGSPTQFSESNAYLGVGDLSYPSPAASQTALAATSYGLNKFFMPMESGYPTTTSQQATFRADFAAGKATMSWYEFCVVNKSYDGGAMLNRMVSSQGYKTAEQVWTLVLVITIS